MPLLRDSQDAKTKGAMSMLGLLLFLGLAISFLLSPETLRNLLKLLVIAVVMLAGLAAASTPPISEPQKGRPPAN
jgi:predicted branched-subunit amino acid permease